MQFSCYKDSARDKRCCKRLKILQEMRESQQHLDSHGMYSTKLWSIAGKYLEDPKVLQCVVGSEYVGGGLQRNTWRKTASQSI